MHDSRARRRSAAIGIALATLAWTVRSPGEDGVTAVVAIQGDIPPDDNGTFAQFNTPVVNDAGQVAFGASLINTTGAPDDQYGIYRADGTPGSLVTIAREYVSFFGPGITELDDMPAINNAGQVATHRRSLALIGGDRDSYLISDGAVSRAISPFGQTAPDGNGTFTDTLPTQPSLSDSGAVAFRAGLVSTAGGTGDDSGVFRDDGSGPLVQIVREGDDAPNGVGAFGGLSDDPSINGAGQVGFRDPSLGVFRGSGGPVTRIARLGQTSPDGVGSLRYPFLGSRLNGAGAMAFSCAISTATTTHDAILRGDGGITTTIVREGDPAPDGDGAFSILNILSAPHGGVGLIPSLNDAGQVAFKALLTGTDNTQGVFLGDGSQVTRIARTGQPVPDGVGTFAAILTVLLQHHAINEHGDVVFSAQAGGMGVTVANDYGIFLGDGVDLLVVAREGQPLAGGVIESFNFESTTGSAARDGLPLRPDHGGRSPINDSAQVAFRATLTNGRDGVFLFTPDLRWRAGGDGDWDDNANWTLGVPPGAVHAVTIDPATDAVVTGPAAAAQVRSLAIGGDAGGIATLSLRATGELTATSGVTIEPAGVLSGVGGAGGLHADVASGGVVSPDPGPAALALDGAYDQTGGLVIRINSQAEFGALAVSGDAALGGDLTVEFAPGFAPNHTDRFEILTAAAVTGTFDTVTGPGCPQVSYEPDRVVLTFPCAVDANADGEVDVFDLLAYLALWFDEDSAAEFDGDAAQIDVFDLLAYLSCWFPAGAGLCP